MNRHAWLAALALPGCAALVEDDWQGRATHPALPPYHLVVSDADMENACGAHPWAYVFGCALRLPAEHVCLIYTRPKAAAWILAHEQRHCDGWDHAAERAR